MSAKSIYSFYKICEALNEKSVCFKLYEYSEGEFIERFHDHIPKFRISQGSCQAFIKTLLIKYGGYEDSVILRFFINDRAKSPARMEKAPAHIEYPEPGVLRIYQNNGPFTAWHDTVIDKLEFRTKEGSNG